MAVSATSTCPTRSSTFPASPTTVTPLFSWPTPEDNGSDIEHYTITAINKADHNVTHECATVPVTVPAIGAR